MERCSWVSRDITQSWHRARSQNHTWLQNQVLRKNTLESQDRKNNSLWGLTICSQVLAKNSLIINSAYVKYMSYFWSLKQKNLTWTKQKPYKQAKGFLRTLLLRIVVIQCLFNSCIRDWKKETMKMFLSKFPFIQHEEKIWWQLSHFLILYDRFQSILCLTSNICISDT